MANLRHNKTDDDYEIITDAEGTQKLAELLKRANDTNIFIDTCGTTGSPTYATLEAYIDALNASTASYGICIVQGNADLGNARTLQKPIKFIGGLGFGSANQVEISELLTITPVSGFVAHFSVEEASFLINANGKILSTGTNGIFMQFRNCDKWQINGGFGNDVIEWDGQSWMIFENIQNWINNSAGKGFRATDVTTAIHHVLVSGVRTTTSANPTEWVQSAASIMNLQVLASDMTKGFDVTSSGGTVKVRRDGASDYPESLLLGGSPTVILERLGGDQIRETGGPTILDVGEIPDGHAAVRIGSSFEGTADLLNQISTGLTDGGDLSINGGDATLFDVSAGSGLVVDNHTDPDAPTRTPPSWTAFTAEASVGGASDQFTFVAINAAGALVKQNSPLSDTQRRDLIFLGLLHHPGGQGTTIVRAVIAPHPTFDQALTVDELLRTLGILNREGNIYSPNGANLNIDKSSGESLGPGINFQNDKKNPNITIDAAAVVESFQYIHQDGAGGFTVLAAATAVDPDNYDDGSGTLAAVGTGQYTIQRIFWSPITNETFIVYGQKLFASLADAKTEIGTIPVVPEFLRLTNYRSAMVITEGTTDLTVTANAQLFEILSISGGGSAGAGTGEDNTARNIGAGGIGLFKSKAGVILDFKTLIAGSSKLSVTDDVPDDEVVLDVVPGNILHNDLGSIGVDDHKTVNTVSTTDNVLTTIATIAIPDNTVVGINAKIVGRRTDAADRYVADIRAAVFREAAGSATLQGANDLEFERSSDPQYTIQIAVSGNNALIQVQGDTGHTINWRCVHEENPVA